MPYLNTAAEQRGDIKVFLEEAREADKGLIAERVLGVYQSDEVSGKYPKYEIATGNLLKAEADIKRAPGGAYKRVNRSYVWDSYDCEDQGLEGSVDDTDEKKVKKFFDMEVKEAKLVRRNVALRYEIDTATLVMDPAATGFTATNSVVAYSEANLETINVVLDVQNARRRMEAKGVDPKEASLVLSTDVWNRVRRSKLLLSYVFGNNANVGHAKVTLAQAAEALEIKEIITGGASYDSSPPKSTSATLTPIWGTARMLLANLQAGEFNNGGIGRTITWTADASGLYVAETYREEKHRSNVVRVRQNTALKIIDRNEGELITTQWA